MMIIIKLTANVISYTTPVETVQSHLKWYIVLDHSQLMHVVVM